jgi:hypothetical protein
LILDKYGRDTLKEAEYPRLEGKPEKTNVINDVFGDIAA